MDGPLDRRLDARKAVENNINERTKALQERLGTAEWTTAVAQFNQEMVEARKYLSDADYWYLPHQAEVESAQKQIADHIKLLRDTETAIVQWGKAHVAIARTFQTGLAPDWTLLKESADRIEKSINKMTDQHGTR